MTFDWYLWIWTRIGGRPWTYIIRDFYHKNPVVAMFIVAGVVTILDHFHVVNWKTELIVTAGVLIGHLFWGTPYIPNQQGSRLKTTGIVIAKVEKT